MDMRDHLENLESSGLLRRVDKPVDPSWEVSSMARWLYHGLDEDERFGLLFENVEGSDAAVMTAVLGASRQVYAHALDVAPGGIHDHWRTALANPRPPERVADGPVKERVEVGADASLGDLPIPVWTPRKDAGPYLTALVVTKNRDTGVQNLATYRSQVVDDDTIAINVKSGRDGYRDYQSYAADGDPAPVAIVVGAPPAVHLGSIANVSYDTDETAVAGGLLGDPIETVAAETVDLQVPANAELVVEGEFRPTDRMREGPFGEFAGYMGDVFEKPVIDVTAVTGRTDPIMYGYLGQMPPSESTTVQSISNAAMYHRRLVDDLDYTSVSDVHIDRTYAGMLGHGLVRMDPTYPKQAREVGQVLANLSQLKRVTVVDDDVDVRDPMHVAWALNSRFNPQRDLTVVEDVYIPAVIDPSVETDDRGRSMSSKLVVDATSEVVVEDGAVGDDKPPLSIPPRDHMEAALDSWAEADLPELDPKPRMELMLEHHPGPDAQG